MTDGLRVCVIGKYPPIEGGVSAQTYWMCRQLADSGAQVDVVTNALEVEDRYRQVWLKGDDAQLSYSATSGGCVRVHWTIPENRFRTKFQVIPGTDGIVARLAGLATEVVKTANSTAILAFYLEPYGLAANLVSSWTDVPFFLRHAGSDRYALTDHPEAGTAYKELMRSATGVLSAGGDLSGLGVWPDAVRQAPGALLPDWFGGERAMNIADVLGCLRMRPGALLWDAGEFDQSTPVVGSYGKLGLAKCTKELVLAVSDLIEQGEPLQLVMIGSGPRSELVREAIATSSARYATWWLPPLAPWRIPQFIRSCSAVAALEHGFSITEHRPSIAYEVQACGVPLVLSGELNRNFKPRPVSGSAEHIVVADPTDLKSLADALIAALGTPRRTPPSRQLPDVGPRYAQALRTSGDGDPIKASSDAYWNDVAFQLQTRAPALVRAVGATPEQLRRLAGPSGCALRPPALAAFYAAEAKLESALRSVDDGERAELLFEHWRQWSSVDIEGVEGRARFPGLVLADSGPPGTLSGETVLVRSCLSRVEEVGTGEGGQCEEYLVVKLPSLRGRVFRVGKGVRAVLARLDGWTPLAGVAEELASPPELVLSCAELLVHCGAAAVRPVRYEALWRQ